MSCRPLLLNRCDKKAKLLTLKIIEETKKMEIPGCGRRLLCEICEICVSFLENLRYFLAAANVPRRLLLLSVLLTALGCGQKGGLPLASVEGSVAYGGKLLDHGKVVFTPQAGTPGPPAVGKIQPDGSFVMQTTGLDGAAVGSHKVTVHCRRELTPQEIKNRSLVTPESLIPDKYWKQEESPLTFEVESGEFNVYDIVLE